MKSMTHLTPSDQQYAASLARQTTIWFNLFDCFNPSIIGYPPQMKLTDRLEIIDALYRMPDFRAYVGPFLKDDARITAFEDAVAEAVYAAIAEPVGA